MRSIVQKVQIMKEFKDSATFLEVLNFPLFFFWSFCTFPRKVLGVFFSPSQGFFFTHQAFFWLARLVGNESPSTFTAWYYLGMKILNPHSLIRRRRASELVFFTTLLPVIGPKRKGGATNHQDRDRSRSCEARWSFEISWNNDDWKNDPKGWVAKIKILWVSPWDGAKTL